MVKDEVLSKYYDEILGIVALGRKKGSWKSISTLISLIEEAPSRHAPSQEITNITKRCVKVVYDSKIAKEGKGKLDYGMIGFSNQMSLSDDLAEEQINDLRDEVLEEVRSFKDGIDSYVEEISKQSQDYLKPNDKIIVWEYDSLVASFINWVVSSRSRKTTISLLVAGNSRSCVAKYHKMFKSKIESQILQVTFIGDGGFLSVMPIVQKVIIPVQLLLPDGSIRCPAGLRAVCLAARQHAVPVIGLCQYHNVSFAHPMNEVELGPSHNRDEIRPLWDSVKTNLISLIITPEGALPPSDTYRLHNELYGRVLG